MTSKNLWINLSIVNLFIVACLGVLMRSKMIFDLPRIDYNRLVDTHGHFAFMGWVTLALITLMVFELPGSLYNKKIYHFLLGAIFLCSWTTLFTSPFESCKSISEYISFIYILFTYIFAGVFIKDILRTNASKTVKLLSVSSAVCLVLSSIGAIMLAFLFAIKSLNVILYRDALFGYLHLQYNGFFTLAVFALLFNKVGAIHESPSPINRSHRKNIHRFAILLCLSVLPSMFLIFLWHEATPAFRILSAIGAILLLLSFAWFIISAPFLMKEFKKVKPAIRYIAVLSMFAFMIKIVLQSLTFIDSVNVLVFGNRPMIMGFLHLVFLGFVTLFLITYFAQTGVLNSKSKFTRLALMVFTLAVAMNELLLMLQGLGAIFIASSPLFPWYLWGAGIFLLIGALLIAIARMSLKVHKV
jgi:hypothetical protein